ncbi:EF-hand domain-containing family member C2-like [Watersipora subatra]|uniref:EF-hand domain-containing family member C2-like n=1 Tax=Watersipora subatra TaxID=2589382 RepID=UPI00355BA952
MALPFLPGNNFNKNLGKEKFHKSHHFDYVNRDVAKMLDDKSGIGGVPLPGQDLTPKSSVFPRGEGANQPAWVAFDKQVLSFNGYFQESVVERREEQYRVRPCIVYFYLEDDSIQVVEPRQKNAGLPQGTLIRRHRIPRPAPNDGKFYTVEDFNIGKELTLYGRVFKLTSCDEFTRNFLTKLGVRVPPPDGTPNDPYSDHRKALDESMQPLRPYERFDTLKQFLDHDRHVLRFYCFWDDTDSMFGDPRELVLHYFLADDTIEIREVIPANSGRDAAPVFLRRGPVPKDVAALKQPGEVTERTVLNVFGPTGHGSRYILDSLKTGAIQVETYKDNDLSIGAQLNVWGRKIVLCDCDDFTKEFFRTKYGINDFAAIPYKRQAEPAKSREVPPYNGFGSEEDSLCSCAGLLPKPPRRDFVKFMEKDRCGLESNVLRFLAKMDTTKPIDIDRRFIISYFLADDTLLVFEPPVRNSGMGGGKFLERQRVKKPNQPRYGIELSEYYQASDMFVGNTVELNRFKFTIIDADEYAFRYMEQHSAEFPKCSHQYILDKIRGGTSQQVEDVLSAFQKSDPSRSGCINYDDFIGIIQSVNSDISAQEIMTLARLYGERTQDNHVQTSGLVYLIQDSLRKHNFDIRTNKLQEALLQRDAQKQGYLSENEVVTACKSIRVPVPRDMLAALVARCGRDQQGLIKYTELLEYMDWKTCPVPAPTNYQQGVYNQSWTARSPDDQVHRIQYVKLLGDIYGSAVSAMLEQQN